MSSRSARLACGSSRSRSRSGGSGWCSRGALRGTGDTRFPLLIGSAGIWTAVLLVWLILTFVGGGLPAVWAAFLVTSPITAFLTWRRFRARVRELAAQAL
jgi:Na+-driven multidrug efflux pump